MTQDSQKPTSSRAPRIMWLAVTLAILVCLPTIPAVRAADPQTPATARPSESPMGAAPLAVPTVPFLTSVSADGRSLTAAWAPNDPTDEVVHYTVTAEPIPGTATTRCPSPSTVKIAAPGADSAVRIPGLCPQVAYFVRISATNALGASDESPNFSPAVPLVEQVPQAPMIVSVVPRAGRLEVAWTPPGSDGGAAITEFRLTAKSSSQEVSLAPPSEATSAVVDGLSDGVEYRLTLTAVNTVGLSPSSTAVGTPAGAYEPGQVSDLTTRPDGSGAIDLSWKPPVDDGGRAITGYLVTYRRMEQTDGKWDPVSGAPTHSLAIGARQRSTKASEFEDPRAFYEFKIVANNAIGAGRQMVSSTPVTPLIEVRGSAVVLDSTTVAAIVSLSSKQVMWRVPVPAQVDGLQAGDVLVAGSEPILPEGMLRKVTELVHFAGGLAVMTEEAALDDVFAKMSLSASLNPASEGPSAAPAASDDAPRMMAMVPGVRTLHQPAVGLGVKVGASLTFALDLKSGSAFIQGQLKAQAEIGLGMNVNTLGSPKVSMSCQAVAGLDFEGSLGIKGEKSWKIGEISGMPATFMIGAVPVVVVTKMPVYLTAEGAVKANIKASVQVGGRLEWNSDAPGRLSAVDLTKEPSVSGGMLPSLTITGSGGLGLKAEPEASIYALGGPSLSFTNMMTVEVKIPAGPGDDFLSIDPELKVNASFKCKRFGFDVSLTIELLAKKWVGYRIHGGSSAFYNIMAATDRVPAGSQLDLRAVRSDGVAKSLKWAIPDGVGSDTIDSAGRFTAGSPGGRVVTVTVSDDSGASGRKSIRIGNAFDSPSPVRAKQRSEGLAADIIWTTPVETGGASLTDYVIVTQPSTGTHVVPAGSTATTLEKLALGNYAVDVYARNAAGEVSPPGSTNVVISANCTNRWLGSDVGNWTESSRWSAGHVPGNAESICLALGSVRIPSGTASTVSGLNADGATLTVDGTLEVSRFISTLGTRLSGSGKVIGDTNVRWSLSGATIGDGTRLVNRGVLTVTSGSVGTCGRTICLGRGATLNNSASAELGAGVSLTDVEISQDAAPLR